MKLRLRAQFDQNVARVENLINIYDGLTPRGAGRRPVHSSDVLRAGTVLLHASLEEFMKGLARWKFADADAEVLNRVSLLGTSETGRREKFVLGELLPHRRLTVRTLIQKSVEEYLEKTSINNTTDLANMLQSCGVDPANMNKSFNRLSELINRKHRIVHEADHNPEAVHGQHQARSISQSKLESWIDETKVFVKAVLDDVPD